MYPSRMAVPRALVSPGRRGRFLFLRAPVPSPGPGLLSIPAAVISRAPRVAKITWADVLQLKQTHYPLALSVRKALAVPSQAGLPAAFVTSTSSPDLRLYGSGLLSTLSVPIHCPIP
ncbi:hypothetical protein DPEC_G00254040 [Dallia pectoralis]|uniref:Uncharacterized protein n=1 Tax=Dallia pectoralis TaxID=75939 RepID=A0ACC2FU01_DALPE|nr:hypothetical protein DPEC_G00254040 [Dallia pectoralis]